jgi:hypothetical protein
VNDELKQLLSQATANIEDVGRICYGLSRNGAYDAAKRGDIPTIRIGRLLKVPTAALRKQLGLSPADLAA